MESGKIPVLLDIVERGKHAPEENMLGPLPSSEFWRNHSPMMVPEAVLTFSLPPLPLHDPLLFR